MLLKILILAGALAGTAWAQGTPSPYAGQQAREIKSLSDQERQDLLEGKGMGLAKAAELNGYPGPMHVMELANQLQLTGEQRAATRKLLTEHKAAARQLGASIVDAERALDEAFAARRADEATIRKLTGEIARLQGELRAEHLKTHLAQTALLRPEQVRHYAQLRGYGGEGGHGGHGGHGGGHGHHH
ncbi:MAG TPA: periplasmic heavy metal sensor [Ramlibacter sp.]|uniref:Spy/CpxP family protein refolding chaperone n=1 Tax=Ramlibacter sp. TaxID=1917967 RepID=UPI002D7F1526|nr:periplasmic heavy metal sensor [Ramlibacter sp.]HET8746921.1 periplasmic heavy metal sensor [Ramlibacter sp.]